MDLVFQILFQLILGSNLITRVEVLSNSDDSSISNNDSLRSNTLEDENCNIQLEDISNANIVAKIPPQATGIWTSKQCEVRPGPEYLIRKYRFYDGGAFELHQYFYSDSHCHRPTFSIEARGRYKFYQASWIIPGATEVDYHLRYVTIMPYMTEVAADLSRQLNDTSCRVAQPSSWLPYERHVIFHNIENEDDMIEDSSDYIGVDVVDCLPDLDISFHELQLIRVEEWQIGPELISKSLLLGDIHTDRQQRILYRPTAYQDPLESAETTGCKVCRIISKSSDYAPPQLVIRQRPSVPQLLAGSWVSMRCETRPYGVFLTRSVRLVDANRSSEIVYQYFSDGICHQPIFRVVTRGSYQLMSHEGIKSDLPDDAHEILFEVTDVKVRITDKRTLRRINFGKSCGSTTNWLLGEDLDLTPTLGCSDLGVKVNPKEQDIVQVDRRQHQIVLHLGQRSIGDEDPTFPTSFLPPLVRCSAVQRPVGPGNMAYVGNSIEAGAAGTGTVSFGQFIMFTIICLIFNVNLFIC